MQRAPKYSTKKLIKCAVCFYYITLHVLGLFYQKLPLYFKKKNAVRLIFAFAITLLLLVMRMTFWGRREERETAINNSEKFSVKG